MKWIEKEEEFPDGRANVEGMEGLVQPVQLRQRFNQLRDVVLNILLSEEPREEIKIFGESINKLFFHTVGIGKLDQFSFQMFKVSDSFFIIM